MGKPIGPIVQGDDATITIKLKDKATGDPFSLAGFTAASAFFEGTDGTPVVAACTLVSEDLGELSCALSNTQTEDMKAGDELDIEIVVDQGSTRTTAQVLGLLSVAERLFS